MRRTSGWGAVLVRGSSMRPTFAGLRRLVFVRWGARPSIGDVVVLEHPARPGLRLVKRVTDLGADGWWVESDAGAAGAVRSDSWLFGAVADAHILGVVRWPRVSGRRPG